MDPTLHLKQVAIVLVSGEDGVRGQGSQSAFVLQRQTTVTPCVTIWGTISYDSRSSLVLLPSSLTAQRYVDTIL
ncbi:hypothetical protein TNCV_5116161 [Trichonephila clavipes]|nr:hypothetical protein TNCV_5116161 [Trichonephila clavipes]